MALRDYLPKDAQDFLKKLDEFNQLEIYAGFEAGLDYYEQIEMDTLEMGGYNSGSNRAPVDVLTVALYNEYGTSNMPSRPFIRQTLEKNSDYIIRFIAAQVNDMYVRKKSVEEVVAAIGVLGVGLIQKEIISGGFDANAPSTIKKKGSSKPLIDTGRMRQSVHYFTKRK
jgi:hypothetical protein